MAGRGPRRDLLLGAALALVVVTVFAGRAEALSAAPHADRDRDRIFDDLERELANAGTQATVIVSLDTAATATEVATLARRVGGFAGVRRFDLVDAFVATMAPAQVRALASQPSIVHIEGDATVRAAIDSAQASFGVAKARVDAGVDGDGDGSPVSYSKDDLVAAVVDSGIATSHRDLDGGKVIGWVDFVSGLPDPYDDFGHGTAVASVLAGEGDARPDRLYRGVAPGAALVGIKVLDRRGRGSVADVVVGVEWAVAMKDAYGIEAVNLSLEQVGCSDGTDVLSQAANAAVDAGLVVVAAAGNSGPGTCTIGSPGAAAKAITVGAMADTGAGGFRQAAFSSRGPTLDGRSKPDISAPGVSITSAAAGSFTGYSAQSGTSLAAPFVAGVALLMLDASPALEPPDVAARLAVSAVDWGRTGLGTAPGSRGPDVDYGAGRLDGYAALEAAAGHVLGIAPLAPAHRLLEGSLAGPDQALDFPLDVEDTSVPVAATLILPAVQAAQSASQNFDLVLLDPSGAQVAAATTSKRQDDLSHAPAGPGGYVLRVRSVAGGGDFFVDVSAGLRVPAAQAPGVVELPLVSGTARRGSTLTSTEGLWGGTAPLAFARRWQRCDAAVLGCIDIPGANAGTHVLGPFDVGARLRVVVTATNAAGSAEAASQATPVVRPALPRILGAGAIARGHRVRFRATVRGCRPCAVVARIRFGGRWVRARLHRVPRPAAPGFERWHGSIAHVPRGRRRWEMRAVEPQTGLSARSRLRTVLVQG